MTGDGLREMRRRLGLNQGEFAVRLEVGERTIRRAEAAKAATIPAQVAARLAALASLATIPSINAKPATLAGPARSGQEEPAELADFGQAVPVELPPSEIGGSYVPLLEQSVVDELIRQVREQDERIEKLEEWVRESIGLMRGMGEQIGEARAREEALRRRIAEVEQVQAAGKVAYREAVRPGRASEGLMFPKPKAGEPLKAKRGGYVSEAGGEDESQEWRGRRRR